MYLPRTPSALRALMPDLTWHAPRTERAVYLTFDDGPTPGVTPWVLDQLAIHDAKATFFCIGRNAARHPDILQRIRTEGHAVGNHTWQHSNGWRTPTRAYLREVLRCQELTGTRLFRPPYGRITRAQARALKPHFTIVMWDVLSGDFDITIGGARCLGNVVDHARPGSIIVFHDSLKAASRLRQALPAALAHFVGQGYALRALEPEGIKDVRP